MYFNEFDESKSGIPGNQENQGPISGEYRFRGSMPNPGEKPKKEKKLRVKKPGNGGGKIVALALCCALVGGAAGGGAVYYFGGLSGKSGNTTSVQVSDRSGSTSVNEVSVSTGDTMADSEIYNTYVNSVVCVTVQTSEGEGAGTGFFISSDGYILTCYHVINGATAISVTLSDSSSYEATLVGGDEDQDVALLKITAKNGESFTPVVMGDSDKLSVGDHVLTIGNALGTLANTLTTGSVSALDRAISMSDGTVMNLMQTDCTVNSGNSGGPLFNQYGEVIGIVNAKYSSSSGGYSYSSSEATIEGIGFAIPIDDVNDILNDLMKYGYVTGKPYLGISVSTVSSVTAQQYSNMVVGAYVNKVSDGSCAATAGLQTGDIITQADGTDITTSAELIEAKNKHKSGDEMTLTVYRNGDYLTMKVTLDEEKPDTTSESSDSSSSQSSSDSSNSGDSAYGYDFGNGFGGSSSGSTDGNSNSGSAFGNFGSGFGW